MQRLAEGVLTQIASLLNVECAGILVLRDGGDGAGGILRPRGLRLLPRSSPARERRSRSTRDLRRRSSDAFQRRAARIPSPSCSVLYIRTASGREVVVLLETATARCRDTDRALVEVFCSRLSVAFDNVILYEQLQDANAAWRSASPSAPATLTAANARLAAQWARLRRANDVQERDARHRRARSQESARRHPRPHRDAQ